MFVQVVCDAPWEYDEAFLEKHKIDFVAHDDIPYSTEDSEDIYAMIKAKDMFVATERTEGNSRSTRHTHIVLIDDRICTGRTNSLCVRSVTDELPRPTKPSIVHVVIIQQTKSEIRSHYNRSSIVKRRGNLYNIIHL